MAIKTLKHMNNPLSILIETVVTASVTPTNARNLYEAIEKDVKMYQPGTPTKKQARNKR